MYRRILPTVLMVGVIIAAATASAQSARERANVIIPESSQASYDQIGYAPAVEIDGVIYVSGVVSFLEGEGTYEERYARGFETALMRIDAILREAGASLDDVVKITSFHTDLRAQGMIAVETRKRVMSLPHPAWTAVGTPALFPREGQTEIEVIAHRPSGD